MTDWRRMDARSVIRAYARERARRSYPVSPMSVDPEMPRSPSPAPSSGRWEQLVRLMAGVDAVALRILEMRELGYSGHVLRPCIPEYWTDNPTEEARPELLPCAYALRPAEIGRALGMQAAEVRALIRDAEARIAENLGRVRRAQGEE